MSRTKEEAEKIFKENEKLIWFVINPVIAAMPWELQDIYQEASIAMYRCAETWDPSKGKFSTYAVPAISRAVHAYANDIGVIHVPQSTLDEIYLIDCYLAEHPNADESELIREFGDGPVCRRRDVLQIGNVSSGDVPVGEEDEETVLWDFIADKKSNVEIDVIKQMTAKKIRDFYTSLNLGNPEKQKLAEGIYFYGRYPSDLTKQEIVKIKRWYVKKLRSKAVMKQFREEFGLPQFSPRREIEDELFGPELERER